MFWIRCFAKILQLWFSTLSCGRFRVAFEAAQEVRALIEKRGRDRFCRFEEELGLVNVSFVEQRVEP
jgi:hypothetical protein